MSGLEAAATLFGSEDSGSDPFASLGSESQPPVAGAHGVNDDLFAVSSAESSASDFLNTSQAYPERVHPQDSAFQSEEQHNLWPTTDSHDHRSQNIHSNSEQNYTPQEPVQNHGEQWQTYSSQTPYGSTYTNGAAQAEQTYNAYTSSQYNHPQSYTTDPQTAYDPYAPAASQAYAPTSSHQAYTPVSAVSSQAFNPTTPSQVYAPASVAPSLSTYDPYTPPAQSQTATPSQSYTAPTTAASPHNTYGAYASPSQSNYGATYASAPQQSQYAYQNAPPAGAAVPPPAPKAPLNRPKVSNAYDPPFPTTTKRKQARNATSPPSFNHYASMSPPPLPSSHSGLPSLPNVAHPPQGPPSNPYSVPPAMSPEKSVQFNGTSSYGVPPPMNSVRARGTSVDGLPQANEASANFFTYAPSSNPYESSGPAQSYTLPNQPAHDSPYDRYAQPSDGVKSENSQDMKADAELLSIPQSGASLGGGQVPSAHGGSQGSDPRYGSPEVPLRRSESPYNDLPKRASSAAAMRASPRVSSPLASGAELSRPKSSNLGTRSPSPGSNPRGATSFDLHNPKVGQIPKETSQSLFHDPTSSDHYAPNNQTISLPPLPSSNSLSAHDPYAPSANPNSGSGSYFPPYSNAPSGTGSYLSGSKPAAPPRKRSMSNGSMLSTVSEDPYAPPSHNRFHSNESDHGAYTSRYGYPENEQLSSPVSGPSSSTLGPPQEITMKAPTHTPYAPSPSLLGTNDPLGRAGARVPVFSFGFGGKFVTCFHGADKMNTGFDVALASRNSTGVEIRTLNKIIPSSALNMSSTSYPGPLFSDPGSPTAGLVRPGAAAQTKTKKTRIIKYLEERIEELSQGIGYVLSETDDQGRTESKLVLFKILKILIENDGKLSGTPSVDAAVRTALVPQAVNDTNAGDLSGFTSVIDLQGSGSTLMGLGGRSSNDEAPVSVTTLRPSALDKIENFLLRGERRQAYHYALDQKLWAHAMIIASGIDKEAWKEVVDEFVKTELGSHVSSVMSNPSMGASRGREGLRVAYSLLAGQGAKSVYQLVPKTSLSNPAAVLLAPMTVAATPMTPNFSVPMPAANIPAESLSKWAEIVAMILSGFPSPETSATLTALGDQLAGNGWTEAAHVCYLLSPQTSTVAGSQHPSARIVLLGARNPHFFSNFMSDPDPIILSEIHEFALSLVPVSKGQEHFGGFPHLQAYRFIRAVCLAELGDVSLANRYCEAITVSMSRPSAYYTPVMLENLKGLSDRIMGVTQADKGGSWMGGKLAKPSLDGIGGWLEGRFAKLVTGDMESPTSAEHKHAKEEDRGFVGPFSHYSTISSTTTSTSPSPQSSVVNLNAYAAPARTGSALSLNANGAAEPASSAMDSRQRYTTSAGRVTSANASTSTFAQAQSRSFGQTFSSNDMLTPRPSFDATEDGEGQEITWWGSSSAVTPTAANFVQLSGNALTPSAEGFVSLMDNQDYMLASPSNTRHVNRNVEIEDEEDLGFGNSKPKPKPEGVDNKPEAKKEEAKPVPARPDIKPVAGAASNSGSWISRLWKRDSTPGPVKASLGEESTFYYDAELKKWVNKKAGAEAEETAKPATPPPPSRAQTASPAGTARPSSAGPSSAGMRPPSAGPPPARSSSVMENPTKPLMRVRSNLVPSDEPGIGSAPSTPTGSRLAPPGPPPGRPRSQASKRNVRSRYVDVLQQEGSS